MASTCVYLSEASDQQYGSAALGYVASHAGDIKEFSASLGVSAGAV